MSDFIIIRHQAALYELGLGFRGFLVKCLTRDEAVDKAVITDNSRLISNFREHLQYWTWERILEDVNKKLSK